MSHARGEYDCVRVVNATVRALRAQRAISGETAGDLTEALTRVLIEMGLGE